MPEVFFVLDLKHAKLRTFLVHASCDRYPWRFDGPVAGSGVGVFPVLLLPVDFGDPAPAFNNRELGTDQYSGKVGTDLIDDIRRFVSLVNWHLWPRFLHSEHGEVSVASHYTYTVSVSIEN
jgi:hypothetical protein